MSKSAVSQKVAAYITRGERLLVFRHVDHPEAGIQVPGGSVELGEDIATAVLREACEETDLATLSIASYLGMRAYNLRSTAMGGIEHRHYYHLQCDKETPACWRTWEMNPSDGNPAPIAFEVYWVSLDAVPPLFGQMGDLLGMINAREIQADGHTPPA